MPVNASATDMKKWARALYQPNLPLGDAGYVTSSPAHIALSERAAREGMVLLKNDEAILPLNKGAKLATFGKGICDMVKGGGGSGDVHSRFVVTLEEGLRAKGANLFEPLCEFYRVNVSGQYEQHALPGMTQEPVLEEELVHAAADFTDTALITLSRFSGEGWDRSDVEYNPKQFHPREEQGDSMPKICGRIFPKGDFFLTANERSMIEMVCTRFAHVIVVLNIGGIIDTSWIRDDYRIKGALLAWQGGMAGGTAAASLLFGEAAPCGRLPDTFAGTLAMYPSTEGFHESPHYVEYKEDIFVGYRYFETFEGEQRKVIYPFGYGLSYTTFDRQAVGSAEGEDGISFIVKVTNTGRMAGKEVVQLYYSAPDGKLGRPRRELGAFAKTRELAPGESQEMVLKVEKRQMAAFDDLGKVQKSALILEAGRYEFYLGGSVRDAVRLDFAMTLAKNEIIEQLQPRLTPNALPERLVSDGSYEALPEGSLPDMDECAFEKLEPGREEWLFQEVFARGRYYGPDPYREGIRPFEELAQGKLMMDDFLDQLTDLELIRLTGGTGCTGVANTCGFGGIEEVGIPAVMTADGPAGVRINPETGIRTTAWPCATLLASTWDVELLHEVGKAAGEELKENNLCIWLAPAINIHRNPMCGRNFEYFSEDPLLTGKLAAAEVRGIQSNGVSACIKHFACNNKETNRRNSDSRVSERALREIYLRAFEIVVKEADPWTIMTSYNVINGVRASENKELLTDILRGEWGYKGVVTTDWWTKGEHYKEIKAGNDIKMATGFCERVQKALDMGVLSREELLVCARRVLELICKLD